MGVHALSEKVRGGVPGSDQRDVDAQIRALYICGMTTVLTIYCHVALVCEGRCVCC